jgi:phage gp36-like protein
MAYVTQAQIQTAIPAPHLVDALDDDRDGTADASLLDEIIAKAGLAVDAYLGSIFEVPFATPPSAVKEAAFIFACELIYDRREAGEKNPFRSRANTWRERLEKIGSGELPLDAATDRTFEPGAAITETAVIDSSTR